MGTLQAYYAALKPERTYANVMTTAAGFLFASAWHIEWGLLFATLLGTTMVVMSACAVNNATDRSVDARMPRTKARATATGQIPVIHLIIIAAVLGILGFVILLTYVNMLTAAVGAIAYLDYVWLYAWSKRTTVHSTLIGTISGAAPIVAGYTAVTNSFDMTALVLGLIMVFWQMPHFYAIAIFRKDDYAAGNLPVWSVKKGVRSTQLWMLVYTVLYVCSIILFAFVAQPGYIFTLGVGLLGIYWLYRGFVGLRVLKPIKWARGMFGLSLITLLTLSAGVAFAPLLP